MKRFGVVLLVLLVVACGVLLGPRLLRKVGADLGSFSGNTDFGGSDWGSSGWDNGSSGWDSDDGDNGFFFFPIGVFNDGSSPSGGNGGFLVWVVLILLIVLYLRRAKAHGAATQHAGAAVGAARTPDSKLRSMDEYARLDPNFSGADLREKLSNVYVQMQNGCTARNIEALRPYFTDALYQQFDRQIKSLSASHRINRVDRIAVLDVGVTV